MTTEIERLSYFIRERESIRRKKESGGEPPWTDDPILRQYRFTNVRREDDKVTRWLRENWRIPHTNDPHLWHAMLIARTINQPATLARIGYPENFDDPGWKLRFLIEMNKPNPDGSSVYNPAYMIRSEGGEYKGRPKAQWLLHALYSDAWEARDRLAPKAGDTLDAFHARLTSISGLGGFYAGQIVADAKWHLPLRYARDHSTFAASGPGSRKGLNYLSGRDPDAPWSEAGWRQVAGEAYHRARPLIGFDLDMQDWQNCLCEFSKYSRALAGGRPKQNYRPNPEPMP